MLRDVDVPLRPLTVLVGENNSGKSTLMEAVRTFTNETHDLPLSRFWRNSSNVRIKISISYHTRESGQVLGSIEGEGGRVHTLSHDYNRINNALRSLLILRLPSSGPITFGAAVPDASGPPALGSDGRELPGLFDHLLRTKRKWYDNLVTKAKEHIPGLRDINIIATDPATRSLELTIEGDYHIDARETSIGVRVMLYYLALAHHPSPPSLLMIDEPENGIHPKRLGHIVKLLRSLSKGETTGKPTQIILATHSPYLLDHIDPNTDQVLVFRRGAEGDAIVNPVDTERLKLFLDDFMLGEVWYNQGEKGIISKDAKIQ